MVFLKVYIVSYYVPYEQDTIIKIFFNKESAKRFADSKNKEERESKYRTGTYEVEEWEVV